MFKRNDKKNRKDTLKQKNAFAARFSCCGIIDFNSILNTFREGYDKKFNIKIFGIYRIMNCQKSRDLVLFKRNNKKNRKDTLTQGWPTPVTRAELGTRALLSGT